MPETAETSIPLLVKPKEGLFFPPPLDRPIENVMQVKNESNKPITFKIKTTAPTSYHVKPRMRVLVAGETCNVKITLRPQPGMQDGPTPQHKFQIEARNLTPDELEKLPNVQADALWVAGASTEQITRIRINCQFVDDVPAGIQLSYPPIHEQDTRSEASYISDAPVDARNTVTSPKEFSTVSPNRSSSPMNLEKLQQEVQHLRQSLAATEQALHTAGTRTEALKAECEAAKSELRAAQAKKSGGGFLKWLLYLVVLGAAGWSLVEHGPTYLCPAPSSSSISSGCTCPPVIAEDPYAQHVVDIVKLVPQQEANEATAELETGPGLEKPNE